MNARTRQRKQGASALVRLRPVMAVLLVTGLVIAVILGSGALRAPDGRVVAASTQYDFGQVPIGGGNITTKFPLTLEGDARAVEIAST